ncbi:hypothetical protein TEA_029240 [Camellia sinensis var. sinensis]|uniref:Uncharacterized protein n=2 Tax=Camellia sinensis TaxID=4442 RepID=A0A4S4DN02_CAMSN|nr:hypothetical protein TEA_029240 [Camellia sinensis var. sinensis]
MATTTIANSKISLKLLIDTNSNKVLFAEAKKDFVDLLFGLFALPLGTILALLTKHDDTATTFRSLSRVYQSVQNLDNDYLQPNQTNDTLLTPKIGASNTAQTPLLKQFLAMADPPNQTNVDDGYSRHRNVNVNVNMVHGFVKGVVTSMVMGDLMVKPMSSISSIALLNNLKVKDITNLQEKTVTVDMDEGLKLFMKAFSKSTTVLTDMFLPIKPNVNKDQGSC